jgi:putative oxidoreductase
MERMMNQRLIQWRQNRASNWASAVRILLGVLFLSTGVMKIVVPELRTAFFGQLMAAGIPFHALNMWVVPAVEIGLGALLLTGWLARLASLVAIAIMVVATYVHLVVDDPTLFPLQPEEPIIPIIVIALCLYLLWRGSGSWRLDRRTIAADR